MSIDLNGWDLVAAITYDDVNAAIANAGSSPKTFTVTSPDNSASMSGTFGTWSLIRGVPPSQGASGDTITIQIPITGGTLTIPQSSLPLTPCTATAKILASYIPQPPSMKALVPAQSGTVPAEVTGSTPTQRNNQGNDDFLRQAAFQSLLTQWLTDNIGSFNQVFAVVDLEVDFSSAPTLAWMRPTYLGYATGEPAQLPGQPLPKSVLAVLALVDNDQPTSSTVNTVSTGVIPTGADAGLLISPGKFLQYFMLPGTKYMFDGQPDPNTSFRIDDDQLQITSTVDLNLPEVSLENGRKVKPAVPAADFSLQVVGSELLINLNQANYVPTLGFEASITYNGVYTISLDTTNRILKLNDVSHQASGSCQAAQGYFIAEVALGVVTAVTSIVAGVAGGVTRAATAAVNQAGNAANIGGAAANGVQNAQAAAAVQITILRGLYTGTVQEITTLAARAKTIMQVSIIGAAVSGLATTIMPIVEAILKGEYSSAPKLDELSETAVGKIITWPASIGAFKLSSAQLNGCLQLGLVHTP